MAPKEHPGKLPLPGTQRNPTCIALTSRNPNVTTFGEIVEKNQEQLFTNYGVSIDALGAILVCVCARVRLDEEKVSEISLLLIHALEGGWTQIFLRSLLTL